MRIKTFIIDAFTNEPFKGNPAGVCLLDEPVDVAIMQSIANELNLSETAFLKQKDETHSFSIRYFTPTTEIAFCGHATLASSKLLLDKLGHKSVAFTTFHGLNINAVQDGADIKMTFPLYDTVAHQPGQDLYDAFGIAAPLSARFAKVLDMLIIEVADKETLLNINPNFAKAIESSDTIKELVVTTKSEDAEYDFYSRCFCPWIGINEDPVTGAAHSVLAKYWGDILNKQEMSAYQASTRGGFMKLKILNDTELEVRSNAQIVFEGFMTISD